MPTLYYATNRRHLGDNQWEPEGYSNEPSKVGIQNLRFGKITVDLDENIIQEHLSDECGFGEGNGNTLADYIGKECEHGKIEAFKEKLSMDKSDDEQEIGLFGSTRSFSDLQELMVNGNCDLLVFIHGFNVNWRESVASAMSLEYMVNKDQEKFGDKKKFKVVLFSWPSDGKTIPFWSYYSDRDDAEVSGATVGRGFLKVRDFLLKMRRLAKRKKESACSHEIHLLCHSMGNYILQNALKRTEEFSVNGRPPRIFGEIFLCSSDVDDDVFEINQPFRRLPEMAEHITVYHNRGDLAIMVSDYTKGSPDRLGWRGASRPAELDSRVHQVDCSPIVSGIVEHSYYQCGLVNKDIRKSLHGIPADDPKRDRQQMQNGWPNVWRIRLS